MKTIYFFGGGVKTAQAFGDPALTLRSVLLCVVALEREIARERDVLAEGKAPISRERRRSGQLKLTDPGVGLKYGRVNKHLGHHEPVCLGVRVGAAVAEDGQFVVQVKRLAGR